jgi:hypothetical protein
MATNKTISKTNKQAKPKIPAGATVINKNCTVNIEEIENGYLITKNYDLRYQSKDEKHTEYLYWSENYYTEDEPMLSIDGTKSLADIFND